jgi:hypothetical protein
MQPTKKFEHKGLRITYREIAKKIVYITGGQLPEEINETEALRLFRQIFSHWDCTIFFADGNVQAQKIISKLLCGCFPVGDDEMRKISTAIQTCGMKIANEKISAVMAKSHRMST